ncbi:MAG: MmgE/PrpD family protein, partial [Rhizobacter sp.]|nr:MmgE/PrpD family protein [Rhizobacter sp.]
SLVREHDVQPGEIAEVQVEIGPAQASMLRNHAPRTGLEAKFSIEFAVACTIVARRVGLAQLEPAFVMQPSVQALFSKVHTRLRHTVCPTEPSLAESDRVVLHLNDGRRLDSGDIFFATGSPRSPLDPRDLELKFVDCAALAPEVEAARLFDRLDRLETLDDVSLLQA